MSDRDKISITGFEQVYNFIYDRNGEKIDILLVYPGTLTVNETDIISTGIITKTLLPYTAGNGYGAIPNAIDELKNLTWYHIYLMANDSSIFDIAIDSSPTHKNLTEIFKDFKYFKRIGAILHDGVHYSYSACLPNRCFTWINKNKENNDE